MFFISRHTGWKPLSYRNRHHDFSSLIGQLEWNSPYDNTKEMLSLAELWVGDYSIICKLYDLTYFVFPTIMVDAVYQSPN
jgi:hypothetical protein